MTTNHPLYPSQASYAMMMKAYDDALAQWPIQPESIMVDTSIGTTHVLIAGNRANPALIIYHGWNGNASGIHGEFDIRRLAEKYCVYAPDIPGHPGRSAQVRPSTADETFGIWAREMIDALGIDRFCVVGPSGGAYMALKTAAYLGGRVQHVLGTVPHGIPASRYPPLRFFGVVARMVLAGRKRGTEIMARAMAAPNELDPEFSGFMQVMMENFKTWMNPAPLSDDELRAITCPVQLIFAAYDITMNVQPAVDRAHRLLKRVEITVLPDEGHILSATVTKRVNDMLMDWVN